MSRLKVGISITIVLLMACKGKISETSRSHVIGSIILQLGKGDSVIEKNGIDTRVIYIVTSHNDTFDVEYGEKIYSLYEKQPHIFATSAKDALQQQSGKIITDEEALFSDYPEIDESQNIFDNNFYLYDTIDGTQVKVVQPKKIGNGITGLYIPKLKDGHSFSIYSKNLDSAAHKKALEMFHTIRFK